MNTTAALRASWILFPVLVLQVLIVAQLAHLFLKHAAKQTIPMTDLLYLAASVGFFALMIVFIWACEKV